MLFVFAPSLRASSVAGGQSSVFPWYVSVPRGSVLNAAKPLLVDHISFRVENNHGFTNRNAYLQ